MASSVQKAAPLCRSSRSLRPADLTKKFATKNRWSQVSDEMTGLVVLLRGSGFEVQCNFAETGVVWSSLPLAHCQRERWRSKFHSAAQHGAFHGRGTGP